MDRHGEDVARWGEAVYAANGGHEPQVGKAVKCEDGTWGIVKEVRGDQLIVKVDDLDETWDKSTVVAVGRAQAEGLRNGQLKAVWRL